MKTWIISLDGFGEHELSAPTKAGARYADWLAAKEVGYFSGKDGFARYLRAVRVREKSS